MSTLKGYLVVVDHKTSKQSPDWIGVLKDGDEVKYDLVAWNKFSKVKKKKYMNVYMKPHDPSRLIYAPENPYEGLEDVS